MKGLVIEAPDGAVPQFDGNATWLPPVVARECTISQLALFRHEPFFAKKGHTVPGGFAAAFPFCKCLLVARFPTGGQCMGVRAAVSLRTVPVVTEVKADLLLCITALTLTLGGGHGLVRSGLKVISSGLGRGLDFRLELRKLLLGVSEFARGGVCAGA